MFSPVTLKSVMHRRRILAYGEDILVISTRAMILSRAGYDVIYTTHISELIPLLRGIFFDMLLVGDSMRTPENVRLVKRLREHFPALPIVMVQDEKEDRDPWSTAFVSSSPEQMLISIGVVLEGTQPQGCNQRRNSAAGKSNAYCGRTIGNSQTTAAKQYADQRRRFEHGFNGPKLS